MADEPTLYYVDADGNEVPEGDPRAVKQYRTDDPARPKTTKAKAEPADTKARKSSDNK